MTVKTTSALETQKFGEEFAQKIKDGAVVCLYGDLGAGKTTLVQGIARGLGIKKKLISPTFIVIRNYHNVHHIDLYRLESGSNLGLEDLWQDPKNILLIEWPERAGQMLPKKRWEIKMTTIGENEREISYEDLY